MIIHVDNNRDGYVDLFTKAYELLLENKIIEANDSGRLTSLEEFFSYIQDIIELDDRYLIRLPVDEPTLTIDANKRTIDTSIFGKSVTVQSDQIAEILVFSIDRYFDYKDLADDKIQIWVQWTAPDGKGGYVEGATYVTHKDTETEKGKLRFGWPIHNEITANPGTLQFAVRFFMKDDVEDYDTEGNLTKVNKIVYSLNTLPATLQIKSALQPELNDDVGVSRPAGLFSYAVRNSVYTGEDVAIPQTPTFEAPGSEPPMEATLDENDTLTLMAQAVSGDAGSITYKWYYKSINATAAIDCEEENWGTIGTAYRISSASKRILSDDYYNNESVSASDAKDIYYSHIDNETVNAFKIHTGKVDYKEQSDGTFMLVDDMGRPLYEKYTTLTVPTSGDVTGTYTVKAWNTTTIKGKAYTSNPRESRECVLVSPTDINVVDNLTEFAFIVYEDKDGEQVKVPAEIQIVLTTKENDNTEFNYAWYRTDAPSVEAALVLEKGSNKYNAETPGWYKTYITAHLNRQTNEYTSSWSKVTNKPEAPIIAISSTGGTLDEDGDNYTWDVALGTELVLSLDAHVSKPEGYEAAIGSAVDGPEDLYSEGLSYAWTLQIADGEERPLVPEDIVDGDITANSITVNSLGDIDSGKIYTYKCIVTNTLNGEIAASAVTYRLM